MQNLEITRAGVIVGEGGGDEAFFRYLCDVRGINGFQYFGAGGVDNYEGFLKSLPKMTGFSRLCKVLIVVGDNDDAIDASWTKIRKYIKNAKLPTPNEPLKMAKHSTGDLEVYGMMIPFDDQQNRYKGCLETLLLKAVQDNKPELAKCIKPFSDCLKMEETVTNGSHLDKFRLRAILAAAFPDDPNFALQWALSPKHGVMPLNHAAFDGIEQFLRTITL
jgi:hypothetical protein